MKASKIYSVRDNQVFNLEGLDAASAVIHCATTVSDRVGQDAASRFAINNGLHPRLVALAMRLEAEARNINRMHVGKRYMVSEEAHALFVDNRFGTVASASAEPYDNIEHVDFIEPWCKPAQK